CVIKSQPQTFVIMCVFFAHAIKFLKNEALVFWGNANSIILYADVMGGISFVNSVAYRQFSTTIFYCIVQQIYYCRAQIEFIGFKRNSSTVNVSVKFYF